MPKTLVKIGLLGIAMAVAVIAVVRLNEVSLPEGPVPIVWDDEVCAHCKMHVGDPRFAAQLQTVDGHVLNFDDPGCLFDYLEGHEVQTHELYFRDHRSDGWLSQAEAGFIVVDGSPMGYGIAAVKKGSPDARGIEWARDQVSVRSQDHHEGM